MHGLLLCSALALRRLSSLPVLLIRIGRGINAGKCQLAELFVGGFLLLQRFLEKLDRVVHLELFSPRAQRAVAGDLIVFDSLGAPYESGIQDGALVRLANQPLGLFGETL
jgi:muramidase (phage lysozyme)